MQRLQHDVCELLWEAGSERAVFLREPLALTQASCTKRLCVLVCVFVYMDAWCSSQCSSDDDTVSSVSQQLGGRGRRDSVVSGSDVTIGSVRSELLKPSSCTVDFLPLFSRFSPQPSSSSCGSLFLFLFIPLRCSPPPPRRAVVRLLGH